VEERIFEVGTVRKRHVCGEDVMYFTLCCFFIHGWDADRTMGWNWFRQLDWDTLPSYLKRLEYRGRVLSMLASWYQDSVGKV